MDRQTNKVAFQRQEIKSHKGKYDGGDTHGEEYNANRGNDGSTCSADGRQSGCYEDECRANQAERGNNVEMRGADGRKEDAANASLVDGKGRRDANPAESGNDGEKCDTNGRKEDAVNASP